MFISNNFGRILCAVFMVFLIITLTPAIALEMNEIHGNDNSSMNNHASSVNKKQNLSNDREQLMQRLDSDLDKIDQKTVEINKTSEELKQQIDQLNNIHWYQLKEFFKQLKIIKNTTNELKDESKDLENLTKDVDDINEQLKVIDTTEGVDTNSNENAQEMVNELQSRLNTSFSVNGYNNNTDLSIGDILQYQSGKYYRYVTVQNITNTTVALEGHNQQTLLLPKQLINQKILKKITPNTPIDSRRVVETAYNIQKDDLDKKFDKANDTKKLAKRLRISGTAITITGAGLTVITALILGVGLAGLIFTGLLGILQTLYCLVAAGVLIAVDIVLLGAGITLSQLAGMFEKKTAKMLEEANGNLHDLDTFLSVKFPVNHVPVANNMTLNTTVNNTLDGVLNATDEDNDHLNGTIVEQPKHGNLTLNETKFTYTPTSNYIGNDTFNYTVVDTNGTISNIATVTIEIKANRNNTTNNTNTTNTTSNTTLIVNNSSETNNRNGSNLLTIIVPLLVDRSNTLTTNLCLVSYTS